MIELIRAQIHEVKHLKHRKAGPADIILDYTEYSCTTEDNNELHMKISIKGPPKFDYGDIIEITVEKHAHRNKMRWEIDL